jgi:hypothetical protein
MQRHFPSFRINFSSCTWLGIFLLGIPQVICAQAAATIAPAYHHVISISPAELFYKTQVGYEHRLGQRNSLGALGSYHYGNVGNYQGGQVTGYYRHFFLRQFPTGFYGQLQVSALYFSQPASLIEIKTRKSYSFDYQSVSAGCGFGFGYRGHLLRQATSGHLLYNTLLGVRFQHRPLPSYDATIYRPEIGFLGETDDTNWHLGFGPGSATHGLLMLEYQF